MHDNFLCAVEEDFLPPAKILALFNREGILEVVAVSSTVPGEAQSHPCKAFHSVLSRHERQSAVLTIHLP